MPEDIKWEFGLVIRKHSPKYSYQSPKNVDKSYEAFLENGMAAIKAAGQKFEDKVN